MRKCQRCGISDDGHPGSWIFTGCPGWKWTPWYQRLLEAFAARDVPPVAKPEGVRWMLQDGSTSECTLFYDGWYSDEQLHIWVTSYPMRVFDPSISLQIGQLPPHTGVRAIPLHQTQP